MEWSGYTWVTEDLVETDTSQKPTLGNYAGQVEVDLDGWLHLNAGNAALETGDRPVGIVSCTSRDFHWGSYEIEAKLPRGKNLQAAFLMLGWNTWPPEIAIFTATSNQKGSYFKWNPFSPWKVETDIKYSNILTGLSKIIGSKSRLFTSKNPSNHFIKYRLEWTSTFLKFYYNGRLVRTVTDREVLEQVNCTEMNIVLKNEIIDLRDTSGEPASDFIIKYFNYTPI
jgi:hypothetical protein